jgi:ABC-2 type transport system permease protein
VTALIRSELLKVRTTRGGWAYPILIVLLAGLAVVGDIGSAAELERDALDFQLGLVDSTGIAALLAIILGITMVTTEFRHGTITPTFLAAPRRERVLGAKSIATGILSLLFAILALAIVAAVGIPLLSALGAELHLGDGELATRAVQGLLLVVLWGLLGLAIGTAVHSQIAGLVGTLLWVFLAETLLIGLFGLIDVDGAAAYLPFQALDAADGTGGEDLLRYWPGVGVSLAWIAAVGAVGVLRTLRRDIT